MRSTTNKGSETETVALECPDSTSRKRASRPWSTAPASRSHAWPGNLEELRATCSALAARGGAIDAGDLPPVFRVPAAGGDGFERMHIRAVLSAVGGSRSKAAENLGIHRKTPRERLKT